MLALSFNVEKYLGGDDRAPDVLTLTCMFFFLNFLAATQGSYSKEKLKIRLNFQLINQFSTPQCKNLIENSLKTSIYIFRTSPLTGGRSPC